MVTYPWESSFSKTLAPEIDHKNHVRFSLSSKTLGRDVFMVLFNIIIIIIISDIIIIT